MKKSELLERSRGAHGALVSALEGLTEETAARVGVNAQWSVKDVLAHIAAWEAEGVRRFARAGEGGGAAKLDKEAIDSFNAAAVEERRSKSFGELREEYEEAYRGLTGALEALPDELDESSREYRFAEIVAVIHPTHHAAQIEEWKRKLREP
ncbi:MAG TPA: maleylpyruvate isomerase N-terminal domain-containing protein [Pyrinomonadaceae bacterium]